MDLSNNCNEPDNKKFKIGDGISSSQLDEKSVTDSQPPNDNNDLSDEDNFELVFEDESDYGMEEDDEPCLPPPFPDVPETMDIDLNQYSYQPQELNLQTFNSNQEQIHDQDEDNISDEDFNDVIWDEVVGDDENLLDVVDPIDHNEIQTTTKSYDTQFPGLNNQTLTITLDTPPKKKNTIGLNKEERDLIINLHRSSLLGWVAVGKYWYSIMKNKLIQAQLISLLPNNLFHHAKLYRDQSILNGISVFMKWWRSTYQFQSHQCIFCNNKVFNDMELDEPILQGCSNLMTLQFMSLLKGLGYQVRLIIGLQLITSYRYFLSLTDENNNFNEFKYNGVWLEVLDPFTDMRVVIQPSSNFSAPASAKPSQLNQLIPEHPHRSKILPYVIAFDQSISEVTPRYVPNFLATTTLARSRLLNQEFLSQILDSDSPQTTWQYKEQQQMQRYQVMETMPQTLNGFKNHPLYTLPQFLRKNQFIPKDTKPVGIFRGNPVYPSNSVIPLKSEMNWYLSGRIIKSGVTPLKPNLFAEYQTQLYEPPKVEDGKLPRNDHGNWDLFQPHMLPENTAYVNLPNAVSILKNTDYEYVEAVTGFIFNKQGAVPQIQGVIVHQIDEDEIRKLCQDELERKERMEQYKQKKDAYLMWIDIIKFVKNRDRIKKEYGY